MRVAVQTKLSVKTVHQTVSLVAANTPRWSHRLHPVAPLVRCMPTPNAQPAPAASPSRAPIPCSLSLPSSWTLPSPSSRL